MKPTMCRSGWLRLELLLLLLLSLLSRFCMRLTKPVVKEQSIDSSSIHVIHPPPAVDFFFSFFFFFYYFYFGLFFLSTIFTRLFLSRQS